jgi:hypothetical protein
MQGLARDFRSFQVVTATSLAEIQDGRQEPPLPAQGVEEWQMSKTNKTSVTKQIAYFNTDFTNTTSSSKWATTSLSLNQCSW